MATIIYQANLIRYLKKKAIKRKFLILLRHQFKKHLKALTVQFLYMDKQVQERHLQCLVQVEKVIIQLLKIIIQMQHIMNPILRFIH